jgi:hypothetical protein
MRVDPFKVPVRPKQPFSKSVAHVKPVMAVPPKVRPAALGTAALASRTQGHATTARELQRARAGHAAEAHRLSEVRVDRPAPEPPRQRLARALEPVREAPPPVQEIAPTGQPAAREPEHPQAAPISRVESALQLVERIEVFLRSGRPQLELTVGGQLEAEVLLERTGPREVAVTVRGRNGPPPPRELTRIREELLQRGLKLSSLAIS